MSAPDERPRPPAPAAANFDHDNAPGGPRAVTRGCLCSVLANAAYRSRAEERPFVDPECPVHSRSAPAAS